MIVGESWLNRSIGFDKVETLISLPFSVHGDNGPPYAVAKRLERRVDGWVFGGQEGDGGGSQVGERAQERKSWLNAGERNLSCVRLSK